MSEIDSGGTVFPTKYGTGDVGFHSLGLTKREYFAAMALQGMIDSDADVDPKFFGPLGKWGDVVAKREYQYADSMISHGKGEK